MRRVRLRGSLAYSWPTNCVGFSSSTSAQIVEAAFAVASAWRRQGVGTALLNAAIGWARMSDRSCLRMMFSRHNWPMRRLASKAKPQLDLDMEELIASVTVGGGCTPQEISR